MRGWLLIGALLGALAACATPSGPAAQPSGTPSAVPAGDTRLTIVATDRTGKTTTWTLTCDPPGGNHPDPAAACRALAEQGATSLPPVPKDRMCTQIYGGDETATITGTWRGQAISASFNRANGCEISRWSALAGLLPKIG